MILIVTGLPRSGTSVLAGTIHHLGVPMTENERSDELNPKGYFERHPITGLLVMATNTRTFDGFVDSFVLGAEAFVEQYRDAILNRIIKLKTGAQCVGMKDSRFLVGGLFPQIIDVIREIDDDVRLVTTDRSIHEVAQSMMATNMQDRITHEMTLAAMMEMHLVKEQVFFDFEGKKLNVSFDNLLEDTEETIGEIARFLDVPVTQEALNFPDKTIRRNKL